MTPQTRPNRSHAQVRYLPVSLMAILLATSAHAQQTTAPAAATTPPKSDTVELSPFVVTSTKDKGYFAANTLAGSRMSTNIADLAASISVITKQQIEDTGSIDANDIFRYEINTEGSTTYTPTGSGFNTLRNDGVIDVNGGASTGSSTTAFGNAGANRVRGLGVPSAAINYYPSIGAIPLDSYNIQSVEISRGPNSMLFGMGSPAGIVNQSTANAQIGVNNERVILRADNLGSFRASVSFNRSLNDKLAIYGAAVYDDRAFERKPSYDKTRRQYIAVTYKPFEKTTIRANYEHYRNDNRRPNSLTPRDFITEWNLAGRPLYDNVNRTVVKNGTVVGSYVVSTDSPYANETRNFIRAMPNYNPALRGTSATNFNGTDANFTFYNGNAIFGQSALTANGGFSKLNNIPSSNALFVPGITFVSPGNQTRGIQQIQNGQLVNWFQGLFTTTYRTAWGIPGNPSAAATPIPVGGPAANPGSVNASLTQAAIWNRDISAVTGWTKTNNGILGPKYPGVTDKSVYDWTDINVNEMNFGQDTNNNTNIEFEQKILDNLYLNAGWFRQDFTSKTNYTVSQLNTATLFVDTNINLPDGTPNPFVGKPYVEDFDPDRYVVQTLDDHYRALLAYTPDFTNRTGALKWLGRHQLLGMFSRDESTSTAYRMRMAYVAASTDAAKYRYLVNQNNNADGTPSGWAYESNASQNRHFYLASPSDPAGVVTRSSGEWNELTTTGNVRVYDYLANQFDNANVTTTFNIHNAGTQRTYRQVDSLSAGLTSYLWKERLITTLGVRKDKFKARLTTNAILRDETNAQVAPALTNPQRFVNGLYNTDLILNRYNRYDRLQGTTRTYGGVLRPFRGRPDIDTRASNGSLWWQFVRDFGISYNQSSNFNAPASAQTDAFLQPLPKPTGEGKDIGIQFALFDNKLFARVTWFESSNTDERTDPGTSISRLTGNMDQTLFRNWARTITMINMGMDPRLASFGVGLTPADEALVQAGAEKIWKLPYDYYAGSNISATRDGKAKGVEAEINYNPTSNWTMRFTFGKQDAKYSNVLKEFDEWYAVRQPVWAAAKAADYLLPQYQSLAQYNTSAGRPVDLANFLTSYGYRDEARLDEPGGLTNVQIYYNAIVVPQALAAKDLDGQSAPGQRKYPGSFLTRYDFREGRFKGWFVGGAQRYESKTVIGYYGKVSGFNGTLVDVSDTNRPIYDQANFYTDLFVGYQRRIWDNKVGMKLQLNVDNVFEGGELRPVAVNYDGSPYSFRIIDPRRFILQASFDF